MARTANTSRASHSALAARWPGGRVTMGPHGRDRRVRARTGKRRTPGAPAEDSGDERPEPSSSARGDVVLVEESPAPEPSGPAVPAEYTRQRQTSPGRKRGRLPVPGRNSKHALL